MEREQLQLMDFYGIGTTGILHVGANTGQEFDDYRKSSAQTIVYVEPESKVFDVLERKVADAPGHHAVKALCSDSVGEAVTFNIASNNGQSSSMLPLGSHAELYPDITYVNQEHLVTTTVDELVFEKFVGARLNLLVLDVQGAEVKVLRGATKTLQRVDAIFTEVAEIPLYDGGCTWRDVDALLTPMGFQMKTIKIGRRRWGNAFFVRDAALGSAPSKIVDLARPGADIARGKTATQSSRNRRWSRTDDAQGAVNGKVTGSYGFHTDEDDIPWWQVDLGAPAALEEVMIFNRLGAGQHRAYQFVLKVGADDSALYEVHRQDGSPFGGADGTPARIKLAGETARYVRIELPHAGYLHLDAVEVYGHYKG